MIANTFAWFLKDLIQHVDPKQWLSIINAPSWPNKSHRTLVGKLELPSISELIEQAKHHQAPVLTKHRRHDRVTLSPSIRDYRVPLVTELPSMNETVSQGCNRVTLAKILTLHAVSPRTQNTLASTLDAPTSPSQLWPIQSEIKYQQS